MKEPMLHDMYVQKPLTNSRIVRYAWGREYSAPHQRVGPLHMLEKLPDGLDPIQWTVVVS
jgi:hypothetical protein